MLYPKNIDSKLGFDQIMSMVHDECLSSLGKGFVEKVRFMQEEDKVIQLVDQTDEFMKILSEGLSFPSGNYINVHPFLDKLKPENAFLSPEEFRDIRVSLKTILDCMAFLENQEENFPELAKLSHGVVINIDLIKKIDRVIEENGTVRSNASPELADIRKQLQQEQMRVRRTLDRVLEQAKRQGFIEEEFSITVRNGRMVIPVRSEFKRNIKGFIQDESSSGQTVFLEPAEVLDINNAIRELEYAERREIVKILKELSDTLKPEIPALRKGYVFLGLMDFVRAKAKVCNLIRAHRPEVLHDPSLNLKGARHPLLFLSHQKIDKPTIPLDISLQKDQRIVLISGPNAGGKSVALKTVGLIQYMFQCGFPVPVEEGSSMGLFKDIFIDIGDEQSLENDLSTYSSHLKNMKYFLQFADSGTLFLIDEFGTGTEPHFGGAIAEAVLEKINQNKAIGVITTHYANLKTFADTTEGVQNAAMLFDMHLLEPLYKLEIGKPGSSFAIEIAKKTGIAPEVIESAMEKVGDEKVEYDRLIKELEKEKSKFRRRTEELKMQQRSLRKKLEKLEEQNTFLETHRKKLMNEAKQEAKGLIAEANQKIEETIRLIKEENAEKLVTKEARKDLDSYSGKLKPEKIKYAEPEIETESGEINAGDAVKVIGQDTLGEVLAIKGKEAEIRIGSLKSTIKIKRLQKISKKAYKKQLGETATASSGRKFNLNEKYSEFSPNIDVRGMRAEEAIPLADALVDNAVLFSVPEVRIVHGKGNGILRTVLRDHLSKYPYVKAMEDEHVERGGAGVTVVSL